MDYVKLHSWNPGYKKAVEIQHSLSKLISLTPPFRNPRFVAGADASYHKRGELFYGAVVVFSITPWKLVEEAVAWGRVSFPYIPGLLSFREAPILLRTFRKLVHKPDLIIFDSQGIAHPRGLGLASHMGLLLNCSSIGCAKKHLVGRYRNPGANAGCRTALTLDSKRIGTVVRTRSNVKPVFVSPGHKMDIQGSMRWVLRCCKGYRLPEPTRAAHTLSNRVRLERISSS